jgi:putative drug exporter of the RND superfamily
MDRNIIAAPPHRALRVIAGWLVMLLVAGALALQVSHVLRGGSDAVPGSESVEAVDRAVAAGIPAGTFYPFVAVLHSDREVVEDARFAAAGQELGAALLQRGGATAVQSPWSTGDTRLVGRGRHSALLLIRTRAATFSEAELATAPLRTAAAAVTLPRGFKCEITGQAAVLYDLNRRSSSDLLAAERVGLPLTLLILLIVFRSPVAALLPLALAMTATTISMAGLYLLSRFTVVSVFAENTVTMIGLGVGVDYALLLVGAFRRALPREPTPQHAARRAMLEVRSTILCSGAAVAIGFLALALVRLPFLKALVFGGVVVVAAAVLATLTLLPALLAVLGPRVNWPFGLRSASSPSAFWRRWAHRVMLRPLLAAGLALALLAFFVSPVTRMSGWNLGASGLASDLEARRGYEVLERDFARGWIGPTAIVVEAPPGHTVLEDGVRTHARQLSEYLGRDPRVAGMRGFTDFDAAMRRADLHAERLSELPEPLRSAAIAACGPQGRIATLVLIGADAPESAEAAALVRKIRDVAPLAFGGGFTVRVTGAAAMLTDFDHEIFARMWVVVPAVLLVTFVVLLVHLRSLLIPLKAIALNLLSVLASYGFLVLVFQDGHGARLLGLTPPGGLNAFIVLMLFTILFGLSMDYEVFLLSAIRARYLRSGNSMDAVAHGIAITGGTVTSAAAIMISLFLSFGFTQLIATREFGLGLAFAVALDATIVRLVLLPALMALLGRANWWLPLSGNRAGSSPVMKRRAAAVGWDSHPG